MLRVFGSLTCEKCDMLVEALHLLDIDHEFINVFDDKYTDLCDLNDVNALPHVQILDDNGRVTWSAAKGVTLQEILSQVKYNETKYGTRNSS